MEEEKDDYGPITENDSRRAELLITDALSTNLDELVTLMAKALRDEREAVIDRLTASIHDYCDMADLPGLVAELRKAGDM